LIQRDPDLFRSCYMAGRRSADESHWRSPVKHNDMWDGATAGQKTAMLKAVAACLNDARGTARP
jgi:hypothetical protein